MRRRPPIHPDHRDLLAAADRRGQLRRALRSPSSPASFVRAIVPPDFLVRVMRQRSHPQARKDEVHLRPKAHRSAPMITRASLTRRRLLNPREIRGKTPQEPPVIPQVQVVATGAAVEDIRLKRAMMGRLNNDGLGDVYRPLSAHDGSRVS